MIREDDSPTTEIVPFEIDGHRFGLLAADVLRIVRAAAPARLPRAPAAIAGVLNVHGDLVPVFDLRARFGLKARALQPADQIILVRAGARVAAIVVERTEALLAVPASRLARAPLLSRDAEHVAGVATLPDGSLVICDLASFLSAAEGGALDEALATAAAPGEAP